LFQYRTAVLFQYRSAVLFQYQFLHEECCMMYAVRTKAFRVVILLHTEIKLTG
jgi:hypothetical protein